MNYIVVVPTDSYGRKIKTVPFPTEEKFTQSNLSHGRKIHTVL
jgi:hypothetical protein